MKKIFSMKMTVSAVALAMSASAAMATCLEGYLCNQPLTVTGWTSSVTGFNGQGGTISDGLIIGNPNIVVGNNDAWSDSLESATIVVNPSGLCDGGPCTNGGDTIEFNLDAWAAGGTSNLFTNDESGVPLVAAGSGSLGASVGLIVDEGDERRTATFGLGGGYNGTAVAQGTGETVQTGGSTYGSGDLAVNMNNGENPLCPDFSCAGVNATGQGTVNSTTASWATASGGLSPVFAGTSGRNAVTIQVTSEFETGPIPAPAPAE